MVGTCAELPSQSVMSLKPSFVQNETVTVVYGSVAEFECRVRVHDRSGCGNVEELFVYANNVTKFNNDTDLLFKSNRTECICNESGESGCFVGLIFWIVYVDVDVKFLTCEHNTALVSSLYSEAISITIATNDTELLEVLCSVLNYTMLSSNRQRKCTKLIRSRNRAN